MEGIAEKVVSTIKERGIPQHVRNFHPDLKITTMIDMWHLVKEYHPHSRILGPIPEGIKIPKNTMPDRPLPQFSLTSDKIGHFKFFQHFGYDKKDETQLIEFMANNLALCRRGVILNFRYHLGGNMWPLVNALAPLLKGKPLIQYSGEKEWLTMDTNTQIHKKIITKRPKTDYFPFPIAVVFGRHTTSSGEIVAAIFSERNNKSIRSFGEPTYGFFTANDEVKVKGTNIVLNLTVFQYTTVNKKKNTQERLFPDVETTSPIKKGILKESSKPSMQKAE